MKNKVILLGSSGLVGHQFAQLFSAQLPQYELVALVRSMPQTAVSNVNYQVVDFEQLEQFQVSNVAAVVCCLGTTIKKAGSQAAFRKVDYDYVVKALRMAELNHADAFHVVSAMGANAASSIFYNRVKGEMQQAVEKSTVKCKWVYQPSLLLGNREEFRLGEKLGAWIMLALRPLFIGKMKKYQAIQARQVAAAIHHYLFQNKSGYHIIQNDVMLQIDN